MAMELTDRSTGAMAARLRTTSRGLTNSAPRRPRSSGLVAAMARIVEAMRIPRTDGRMRDASLDKALLSELDTAPDDR